MNIINKVEEEIKKQPRGLAGYHARGLVKDADGLYIVEAGKNVSLFHRNDLICCWLDLSKGETSVPHTSKIKRSGTQWVAFEGETKLGRFEDIFEAKEACAKTQA